MAPARTNPDSVSSLASPSPSDPAAAALAASASTSAAAARVAAASPRPGSGISTGAFVVSALMHVGLLGTLIGLADQRDSTHEAGTVANIDFPEPDPIAPAAIDTELALLQPVVDDLAREPVDFPVPDPLVDPDPFYDSGPFYDPDGERAPDPIEGDLPPPVDVTPTDRFVPLPSESLGGPPVPEPALESALDADAPADAPAPQEPATESASEEVEALDDLPLHADDPEPAEPTLLEADPPAYPTLARRRGWEGSVLLDLHVAADGTVSEATVATSSGHVMLDDAALRAVRTWRFVPGDPDRSVRHRVTFKLR